MADVVPLRSRRGPVVPEPAEIFADADEPGRVLSVSWAPDERAVQLSVSDAGADPTTFVLDADDVVDLVRALVEGLAFPRGPQDPAVVLPLTPRTPDHP